MLATNNHGQETGFTLWCDPQGVILKVLRDDLGMAHRVKPGLSLLALVDQGSIKKTLDFLATLHQQQAAFDWELSVPLDDQVLPLHFAGGVLNGKLLIIAGRSRANLTHFFDELAQVNNEQANALRAALKEQALQTRVQAERDSGLYDEMSRLNNELATLQRELAKKNVILEKLNEQKNQFLGMAAHDLRNPLGLILHYSEFLLAEAAKELSAEHLEFVATIHTSSEFMLRLVNDLLDVTKIESGKLDLKRQPTEIISLIERNVALNQILAARKEIKLEFTHPETFPALIIDESKIEQVLNNLVTNAIKFSHPGSSVTLRLLRQDNLALISVQDRGQGIPTAELEKLFKPFSTTSIKSTAGEKSTGLGLVIVRKIVEGHAGKIWVESETGQGSTFYFSLPLADDCPGPAKASVLTPAQVEPNPNQGRPLRILLAEDNVINQKLALRMLEQLGYHADVVADGQEVLAAWQRQPYDVILMDLHMPGMDGREATRLIRQQGPPAQQPYIIAMTASASDEDRAHCREAGMDDYLTKPAPLEELRQVLQRCRPHAAAAAEGAELLSAGPGPIEPETTPILAAEALSELRDILREQAPEMIAELIDLFIENAAGLLADMQTALAAENGTALQRAAHTLKPGGGYLGALRLAALCSELENLGKAGCLAEAGPKLAELEAEYAQVKLALLAEKQVSYP